MRYFKVISALLGMLAILAFAANSRGASSPPADHLQYTITYSSEGMAPCLNVTLTFAGNASGTSQIALPSGLAVNRIYPNITDVRATTAGTTIADTDKPQIKRLSYPPRQTVTLAYRLAVTDAGQQIDLSYSPEIERDHFSALGMQIFAVPSGSDDRPLTVETAWSVPAGWTLASSYGVRQPHQLFTATPDTLIHSVWAAGDFRVLHTLIDDKSFDVAVRGKWPASDATLLLLFSRILSAERSFWHDNGSAEYVVVLKPSQGDFAGMGFGNSFYETVPPDQIEGFVAGHLFAHEAFHAWLPNRLKLAGTADTTLWLTEWFTDYYARLFQLRTGLISPAEYAEDCNKTIRRYVSSPFVHSTGAQFRQQFQQGFPDNRSLQLAYQQGDLLAQDWNAEIRLASHGRYSLDDVMLELMHRSQALRRPVPAADFVSILRRYLHRDISGDILRFTEEGMAVSPSPDALGACAKLVPTPTQLFDLGYNPRGSGQQGKITGVESDSNAYHAGLRDGQTYIDADFSYEDPSKEAHITVKDQAPQRVISYYPAGKTVSIPQYKLKTMVSAASCLSWFQAGQLLPEKQ